MLSVLRYAPLCFACVALAVASPRADAEALDREALEKEFAETMSGCVMVGSYTVSDEENGGKLNEEKYTLGKVQKLPNGKWLFETRIQYGDHDVTLPLALDVEWAGDTPVITLTEVAVPGLGTFTARVLVHRGQYAGTWSGGDHGGHLFGRIERPGEEESKSRATEGPNLE